MVLIGVAITMKLVVAFLIELLLGDVNDESAINDIDSLKPCLACKASNRKCRSPYQNLARKRGIDSGDE